MSRTQYIFIDFENVAVSDLSRVSGKPVQVFVIVGTKQKNLPTTLVMFVQDHPELIRIIQTPVEGRNALDMVLALELGRILSRDPEGYFHIVSKDNDFKSVVRHLHAEDRLVARYGQLSEIPALKTLEERLLSIKAELSDASKGRPTNRKRLENKIRSAFGNVIEPEFVEKIIKDLVRSGILAFTPNDKVEYKMVA